MVRRTNATASAMLITVASIDATSSETRHISNAHITAVDSIRRTE